MTDDSRVSRPTHLCWLGCGLRAGRSMARSSSMRPERARTTCGQCRTTPPATTCCNSREDAGCEVMPRSFVAQVANPDETFPRLKRWADANGYAIRGNAAQGTFRGTPSGIGGLLIGEISG